MMLSMFKDGLGPDYNMDNNWNETRQKTRQLVLRRVGQASHA